MKKLLLLIILIINLLTVSAYSVEFKDVEGMECEEAVEFLSAYGVVNGYSDGVFGPEEYVTRGQMSKILSIILGYGDYPDDFKSSFSDMDDHWANAYVEVAAGLEIIKGYEDGTFRPDEPVSYPEAVTMILRSLGYTDESLTGDWPYDYMVKAGSLGILKGMEMSSDYASRCDIASIIYESLFLDMGRVEGDTSLWKSSGIKLLSGLGHMEEMQIMEEQLEEPSVFPEISGYLYYTGEVYYNNDDEIVYFINRNTEKFSGTVLEAEGHNIIVENLDGINETFDIRGAETIYNNAVGRTESFFGADVDVIYRKIGSGVVVDAVIGREITDVFLAPYPYEEGNDYNGLALPLTNDNPDPEKIIINGAVEFLKEIMPEDLVYAYETDERGDKSVLELFVVRNRVEGDMTYAKGNTAEGFSVIDKVRYDHSDVYMPSEEFGSGYHVEAILDEKGDIVKHKFISELNNDEKYGFVLETIEGDSFLLPAIRIFDGDGHETVLNVDVDNSLVAENGGFNNIKYEVNLEAGDPIVYTLENIDTVDELRKLDYEQYSGLYRNYDMLLLQAEAFLDGNTLLLFKDDGRWSRLTADRLEGYLRGRIIRSEGERYVEIMVVEDGIKTKYPDSLNGVIESIEDEYNGFSEAIYSFEINIGGEIENIYSSSDRKNLVDIHDFKGKLIQLMLVQDKVVSYGTLIPEIDFSGPVRFYDENLMKVGGSFYELVDDATVYEAEKINDSYIITGTIELSGIGETNLVRLYDLEGDNDGIIDTMIILKE
ncbi:S-layer homology domain-containing protein [Dethiosulfatibacter aminovorans DSM 17477]|uniref:S-layer homology domain-containing protein n=1 Tax=Dethiosulfatibacter aminovorans DSM 17477 TaxID=1121476 RepID=A0A1M6KPL7_9FIRM|nr:S-layer homology domain-containing protein [Dethiosulfatibacter aminovorans]SHJ60804.1 S-layer homology domain-containing protein [Dethiosulfatibacter aminovorans DSM 17477]